MQAAVVSCPSTWSPDGGGDELHDDRATWEQLSRAGLDAVVARHTPAVYAERIEAVYAEAAARKAAAR